MKLSEIIFFARFNQSWSEPEDGHGIESVIAGLVLLLGIAIFHRWWAKFLLKFIPPESRWGWPVVFTPMLCAATWFGYRAVISTHSHLFGLPILTFLGGAVVSILLMALMLGFGEMLLQIWDEKDE